MRISRQSPSLFSTSWTILTILLFSNSALAASDRAECLRTRSAELARLAACGDEGSLNYCLSQLPQHAHLCTTAALEKCFINSGCTEAESQIEAAWTIRRCDEKGDAEDLGDLRRRQKNDDEETTTEDTKTTKGAKTTAAAKTTVAEAETTEEVTTTEDQTTQETTAPQTETTVVSVTDTTATAAAASTFSSTSSSTKLVCYTPTTKSTSACPTQTTGSQSGKTLSCFPTQVTMSVCAEGLLCRSDDQGSPICMKLDNTFTTAGVVVALFLAVSVTAAVAAMCFFCCRERRTQSRLRKAAEAVAIAKAAALDKKRPSVNVRSVSAQSDSMPLMGGQSQGAPVVYSGGQGMDPFGDQHQMR